EDALESGPIFTRAGDDLANAGKTQIDAMSRLGIEAQMNGALQRAARRKGQRSELEIGLAKTLSPDAGPDGPSRQKYANHTEGKHEEDFGVGSAPELGQGRECECKQNPIRKNCRRPQAEGAVAILAFRSARRPVLPPQPRGSGIGHLGCRLFF